MNDVLALCQRLSRPWWGPLHPKTYRMNTASGPLGIGLAVDSATWDYGAWNLTLLQRESFKQPVTPDGHRALVQNYVLCQRLSQQQTRFGITLGELTTLNSMDNFISYLRPSSGLPDGLRQALLTKADYLRRSEDQTL
jgi:hypothetical protein